MNANICWSIVAALAVLCVSIFIERWLSAPQRMLDRQLHIEELWRRRADLISQIDHDIAQNLEIRLQLSEIDDELMILGVDPRMLT